MKKVILSLIAASLLLTACKSGDSSNDSNAETDLETVEQVAVDFQSDYEKCKSKDYVNLDLSNSSAQLPDADSCRSIVVTSEGEASDNATVENFEKYCEYFLGECNHDYLEFRPSSEYTGDIEWGEEDPKIYDYLDEVKENPEDFPWLFYRDKANQKFLWWSRGDDFPHWMNKGEAFSYIMDEDSRIGAWIPTDMDSIVATYFNAGEQNDITYHLPYGDVSLSEAVSYFENEYLDSLPYEFDSNYSLYVHSAEVYELADDTYCYVFKFSTAWKGIPFEWMGEYTSDQEFYSYTVDGEALMIKNDDVDAYEGLLFPNITEETPIENICTLESAVDIMSEALTDEVMFEVQTIGMVYQGEYSDDSTDVYLEPVWKFVTYNPNDGLTYCVYVNAASGECSYVTYSI